MSRRSLLSARPAVAAELDPGFVPAILAGGSYRAAIAASGDSGEVRLGLERNGGLVARHDLSILPESAHQSEADRDDTYRYVERALKFLLWAKGGFKVFVSGPHWIAERLARDYSASTDAARTFDAQLMGRQVYGEPFTVVSCEPDAVPEERGIAQRIGGHLDGCRIGFDLGASDYKLAAVQDGEVVFSTEIPWAPTTESNIDYHASRIRDGLKLAASKLPRVDAIGGSSAGIYIDSQVMVASLFRALSKDDFEYQAKPLFLRMREEWGVPFEVVNDGDVTALAGGMSLGAKALLGVAMGSSEAVGYLDRGGQLTGQLNELAFTPVDMNPASAPDEWSGDIGVGAMSFSQQAVNKLAPAAGISFEPNLPLPERLKIVQERAEGGDDAALAIFRTIGVYLGYAIPHYRSFYDYDHLLILGRVTSGVGGELIVKYAERVLTEEFPRRGRDDAGSTYRMRRVVASARPWLRRVFRKLCPAAADGRGTICRLASCHQGDEVPTQFEIVDGVESTMKFQHQAAELFVPGRLRGIFGSRANDASWRRRAPG